MSALTMQVDELRDRAKVLRQGRWSDGADDAALMEQAADTIESLQERLTATTDYDFATAVHDGELWGKCSTCTERRGHYLDAETIANQQEHIAELRRSVDALQAAHARTGEMLAGRDELIRDMHAVIAARNTWWDGLARDSAAFAERMRELGIEARP